MNRCRNGVVNRRHSAILLHQIQIAVAVKKNKGIQKRASYAVHVGIPKLWRTAGQKLYHRNDNRYNGDCNQRNNEIPLFFLFDISLSDIATHQTTSPIVSPVPLFDSRLLYNENRENTNLILIPRVRREA